MIEETEADYVKCKCGHYKKNHNGIGACNYCGEDIGCIEDPGYYFARTEPPICLCCGKEFEVEDKLRPKGYDKKKGKT